MLPPKAQALLELCLGRHGQAEEADRVGMVMEIRFEFARLALECQLFRGNAARLQGGTDNACAQFVEGRRLAE